MNAATEYDARYLAGVLLFNRRDYFAAHEVWEDLWNDCPAADRRFYQSLIQAAVALYHWNTGNRIGAGRVFRRGLEKAAGYPPGYCGLNVAGFWQNVEDVLADQPEAMTPAIVLHPPPACWPDASQFPELNETTPTDVRDHD
jgi:predicted metal-dependent hydrolase